MRKFVHSYLTASFEIKKVKHSKKITLFAFDAIYHKTSQSGSTETFIYGNQLLKELSLAASVDDETLRIYIKEWVSIYYPDADLKLYWLQLEPEFPAIVRVAARTIASEIVEVKPMDTPKGMLMFLDYTYSGDTNQPDRNGRTYDKDSFNENIAQLIRNQINHLSGELDHPDQPIFISSRKADTPEEIERQSWFNKKDLDNPK